MQCPACTTETLVMTERQEFYQRALAELAGGITPAGD